MTQKARLLLISNSALRGSGYLDYAEREICDFLAGVRQVLFVPYALHDRDGYAAKAAERLGSMGFRVSSVHEAPEPRAAVESAAAIFIGGGNTFRLLKALYDNDLLDPIRRRVEDGSLRYLGASAGSNVACPTIRTTNDMPIVEPPSLKALGLVPFQINPHYVDPDPNSTLMAETREERLLQFLEENETPVVALREGAMLRVDEGTVMLKGVAQARIFHRGHAPRELPPGLRLDLGTP
jgi:dipeptidase E